MGKAREIALQRRADWLADSLDEMREHWVNKQIECEELHAENAALREEMGRVDSQLREALAPNRRVG